MKKTEQLTPDFLKDIKILLVGNNELNQHLTLGVFAKWNAAIDIADTEKKAINEIEKNQYDLILIDLHKSESDAMDAIEFARYIRTNMGLKSMVPIIALTAQVSPEEEKRVLGSGINDYLALPIGSTILLKKLFNTIKGADTTKSSSPFNMEIGVEKLVNFDYLTELSDGDPDFVKEMVAMFLKNTPTALTSILGFNETNDMIQLKGVVHKLKSSLKVFGLKKALEKVEIIEEEILTNHSEQRRKNEVENLNAICQNAIKELKLMDEFSDI